VRKRDPNDRRKVLLAVDSENTFKLLGPFFKPLQSDFETFYEKYSDKELETISEYLTSVIELLQEKTEELRGSNP
jgi:hypothetical protein